MSKYRTAYVNARLADPASGLDAPGALLAEDGKIDEEDIKKLRELIRKRKNK